MTMLLEWIHQENRSLLCQQEVLKRWTKKTTAAEHGTSFTDRLMESAKKRSHSQVSSSLTGRTNALCNNISVVLSPVPPKYPVSTTMVEPWTGWSVLPQAEFSPQIEAHSALLAMLQKENSIYIPLSQIFSLEKSQRRDAISKSVARISKQLQLCSERWTDWFSIGVVGSISAKSSTFSWDDDDPATSTKASSNKAHYQTILLYDMVQEISMAVFLLSCSNRPSIGDWPQLQPGHIVAISRLNSRDLCLKQAHDLIFPCAFIIYDPGHLHVLGKAKDFTFCRPMSHKLSDSTIDRCSIPIHSPSGRMCPFHMRQYLDRKSMSRSELNVPYSSNSTVSSSISTDTNNIYASFIFKQKMEMDTQAQFPNTRTHTKDRPTRSNESNTAHIGSGFVKEAKILTTASGATIPASALRPSACGLNAINKIGFDPSSHRRKAFTDFLRTIPAPVLGREHSKDSNCIDLSQSDE